MALTIPHAGVGGTTANPPPNLTAPAAVAVGDVIAVMVTLFASGANSATITDNLNPGNYTAVGTPINDGSNGYWTQWYYKVASVAGTPTLSCTLQTNQLGRMVYNQITGFTATPTLDSGLVNNYTLPSGSTAVNFAIPNSNFNNEAVLLSFKTASSLTSTPAGWTNSVYLYTKIDATSGTSNNFAGTLNAASYVDAQSIAFYDNAGPTISNVNNGSAISEGATNVAVTGTNFAAGATSQITQPGSVSVAQPFTYTNSTSGTFNLTMEPGAGSQLAFTDATYTTNFSVTVSGSTSANFAITLVPPAGNTFKTLSSVNTTSAYRITATPDLVAGDQLEASGNATGTTAVPTGLQLNADGTWQFSAGNNPADFYVRAYDGVNKVWGAWALQSTASASGSVSAVYKNVYEVSTTGLVQWVHYIPIKYVTVSASEVNRFDDSGAIGVNVLSSVTGLVPWVDYVPVAQSVGTKPWRYDDAGYLPVMRMN